MLSNDKMPEVRHGGGVSLNVNLKIEFKKRLDLQLDK